MNMRIEVKGIESALGWKEALLLLGIRRCSSLWLYIGVPQAIIYAPGAMLATAAQALQVYPYVPGTNHTRQGGSADDVIEQFLSQVTQTFGNDTSIELYSWIHRHLVDRSQHNYWWAWSLIWRRLARAYDDPQANPLPILPPATQRRLKEVVLEWFDDERLAQSRQLLMAASEIPLSELEQRWLALEVTRSDDPPAIDVDELLENMLNNEYAYRVWVQALGTLALNECEAVLSWTHDERTRREMPIGPDLIVRPTSSLTPGDHLAL